MAGPETPYGAYKPEHLILRDHLAMDRTMLANQRTLLAYIRTALAFLVVGGTAVKFFSSPPIVAAGVVFMILAGILTVVGIAHYRTMQAQIESVKRSPD